MKNILLAAVGAMALMCSTLWATVTVNTNTVVYTQSTMYHGVNYVGRPDWDPDIGSTGSMNAMRRSGVHWVRFPGGIPGDWYDWQASQPLPAAAWTYVKGMGAKILYQTNWAGNSCNNCGTAASVAAWVTAMKNASVDAPIWEVGNEPDNVDAGVRAATMTQYYAAFNQQAPAMKAANPNIKVIGPASTNESYWCPTVSCGSGTSVTNFFTNCDANADGYSIHWYAQGGAGMTGAARYNFTKGMAQRWWPLVQTLMRNKTKPFYVTEWSCVGPASAEATGSFSQSIGLAICNADMIGAFSKTKIAGHTMFGCIHGVEDNWGMIYNSGSTTQLIDDVAPQYFVIALWTKMGNVVLNCSPGVDSVNTLSAWAHRKASNNHLTVMLINKTTAARSETVNLGYTPLTNAVAIYELRDANGQIDDFAYGPDDIYYNNVSNPQPKSADLPGPLSATISGSAFTRNLPALSITVLDFDAPNGSGVANSLHSPMSPARFISDIQQTGLVTIELRSAFIEKPVIGVYDVAGNLVSNLSSPNTMSYVWNTRNHSAGTYVVKVKTASGTWTDKVILSK